MSWSYCKSGPALEVAREVHVESQTVDSQLATGNHAERALHSRAVALIDVACHEGKEHDVSVEAYGHFDGKHNHISIKFEGVDAPVQEIPVPVDAPTMEEPQTKPKSKSKPKRSQ